MDNIEGLIKTILHTIHTTKGAKIVTSIKSVGKTDIEGLVSEVIPGEIMIGTVSEDGELIYHFFIDQNGIISMPNMREKVPGLTDNMLYIDTNGALFKALVKQSDWNDTDPTSPYYIQNKPTPLQGEKGDTGDAFIYTDFTPEQLALLKGETGDIGPAGATGEKGDPFIYTDFTIEQLAALKGVKGDTGDPFTFSDFSTEQLLAIKGNTGETGPTGPTGEKGDPFIYTDFTPEQLALLKGETGETGPAGATGEKGDPFIYTDFTIEQLAALKGVKGDTGDPFTFSDFSTEQLLAIKGNTGETGPTGPTGEKGDPFIYTDFTPEQLALLKGDKGDKGDTGDTGISTYYTTHNITINKSFATHTNFVGFIVDKIAGETLTIERIKSVLLSGVCTFQLCINNGLSIDELPSTLSAYSVTSTVATHTTNLPVTLNDNDHVYIAISSVTDPIDLTVSVIIKHVVA